MRNLNRLRPLSWVGNRHLSTHRRKKKSYRQKEKWILFIRKTVTSSKEYWNTSPRDKTPTYCLVELPASGLLPLFLVTSKCLRIARRNHLSSLSLSRSSSFLFLLALSLWLISIGHSGGGPSGSNMKGSASVPEPQYRGAHGTPQSQSALLNDTYTTRVVGALAFEAILHKENSKRRKE